MKGKIKGKKAQEGESSWGVVMWVILALVFFIAIGLVIYYNRFAMSDLLDGLMTRLRGGSTG